MKKLQELRISGVIPNSLSDADFLLLCTNKLKIGTSGIDMNFEIDENQEKRITCSADLNNYKVKNVMEEQHNSVVARYNKLIENYKKMQLSIENDPNFVSEKNSLKSLITNLESERDSYEKTIKGFAAGRVNNYFDFDENKTVISKKMISVSRSLANNTEKEVEKSDKQLNNLYEKLERAKSRNPKMLSGIIRNKLKIRSLQGKINKLRNKQGRLQVIQRTIVETRTNKYVNKMNKKFDKYIEEQNRILEAIDNKKDLLLDINDYNDEKTYAESDLQEAQIKRANSRGIGRIVAKMKVKGTGNYKHRIEEKIKQLQTKVGNVDITKQFSGTFSRSYAR